jgi:hypothetical protein
MIDDVCLSYSGRGKSFVCRPAHLSAAIGCEEESRGEKNREKIPNEQSLIKANKYLALLLLHSALIPTHAFRRAHEHVSLPLVDSRTHVKTNVVGFNSFLFWILLSPA